MEQNKLSGFEGIKNVKSKKGSKKRMRMEDVEFKFGSGMTEGKGGRRMDWMRGGDARSSAASRTGRCWWGWRGRESTKKDPQVKKARFKV